MYSTRRGHFGDVYHGRVKATGQQVAVKKLKRCHFTHPGRLEREALYEVAVLQYLRDTQPAADSEHILRLTSCWELIDVDGNLTCCIVTDWAPGGDIMDAVMDLGE